MTLNRICWIVGCLVAAAGLGRPPHAQAVDPSRVSAPSETQPPAVFLEKLERVERELNRLGEPAAIPAPRPPVLPFIDDARLQSTNVFDVTGVRYVTLRVFFLNQSKTPRKIESRHFALVVDGQPRTLADNPEQHQATTVNAGGQLVMVSEATPPATIDLPAGETVAVQLVFLPVTVRAGMPKLAFRYEVDGALVEIDLNRFQRGRLELHLSRVGPRGACAFGEIGGVLDSINAADLAAGLEQITRQGVRRAVIAWPDKAVANPEMVGWLASTGDSDSAIYGQYPILPSEIRSLHLVLPKEIPPENFEDTPAAVHSSASAALEAALASIYPQQTRETVLQELRNGHPLARAAAVRYGGRRLQIGDVPYLATFMDDPSSDVRRAACAALADFDHEQARNVLTAEITSDSPDAAAMAFEALASSRFAANAEVAGRMIGQVESIPDTELLRILGKYPQPAFRDYVVQAARTGTPEARVSALTAMSAFSDIPAESLISDALTSSEVSVRDAAFSLLVTALGQGQAELQSLAIDEAVKRLSLDPNNSLARTVALQTRHPRLRSILIERLGDASQDRRELIELVGQIGGSEVTAAFEKNYATFTPGERAGALRHLWMQQSPNALKLATEDADTNNSELLEQVVDALTHDASDRSVKILAKSLRGRTQNDGYRFAEALATIGSPAAFDALVDLRDEGHKNLRIYAVWALRNLWSRSPATEASEGGRRILETTLPVQPAEAGTADPLDTALSLFNSAIAIDPLLPTAYSGRGNTWLRKQNWEEAARDFTAAVELNPDDDIALTGFAIAKIMIGDEQTAFEWVSAASPMFENNNVFLYNVACVYSRAAERRQSEPASAERDAVIEDYRQKAFDHLSKSIEAGFEQLELMAIDPDLKSLHDDPRFQALQDKVPRSAD